MEIVYCRLRFVTSRVRNFIRPRSPGLPARFPQLAGMVLGCLALGLLPPLQAQNSGPTLGVSQANGEVTVSWQATNCWLQSAGSLVPAAWVNEPELPVVNGGTNSLTLAADQAAQFYRLVFSPGLPPPTELTLVPEENNAGQSWLALWWDDVPAALSYNLYYATDPSVTKDNYASLPQGGVLTGLTTNYVALTNLIAGDQYYFVATAVSLAGESADSDEVSGVFGQFGDVSGTVSLETFQGTNEFDQEVAGVTITLTNLSQPQLSAQTVSDADGNYGFPNQPAGTYQLSWSAPGFVNGTLANLVVTNEPVDADVTVSNDGSGLVFGHVTLADGSVAAQSDPFLGITENVTVSIGTPGNHPLRSAEVDSQGNYVLPNLPLQSGLTVTANNTVLTVSSNINVTGVQEVDLTLPDAPPVIIATFASANGTLVTQAPPGAALLATVVATNSAGGTNGLHYTWVPGSDTTNFTSADSPIVPWTLPAIPGVQTMYVVVSDQQGGYASARLDVSTEQGVLFTGQVVDTNDIPVVGANISLNGQFTNADEAGDFTLLVTNLAPAYTVVATAPGYLPCTLSFNDAFQNVVCVMVPEPACQQFDSTTSIYVSDAAGSELNIYPNSLVTTNGTSPVQSVCVTLTTFDPCELADELNLTTVGVVNGTNVDLELLGLADVEVYDATGAPLVSNPNLPPLDLNIAADTNCVDAVTNGIPSLWEYDAIAAVWRPAGNVVASTTLSGKPAFHANPPRPGPVAPAKVRPPPVVPVPVPIPIPIPLPPPPPPLESFVLALDKTISLPVNVRILDTASGAQIGENTVFTRTVPVNVVRAALTIQVISPKEGPEVYPPTPLEANKTVIVQDQEAANLPNGSVVTLGLALQIPKLQEKLVKGTQQFLVFKFEKGSDALAKKYYAAVDPKSAKTTLARWKAANGFGADTAAATFFNAGDLGFGRSMHLKTQAAADGNNDVAYYVSNYRTTTDALNNRNLIATVAMDYVFNPATKQRVTAFYVYDKFGSRVTSADLDGNGNKFVPNLCLVCHGGSQPNLEKFADGGNPTADMKSHFLAFDLDSYTYSAAKKQGRPDQEAGFVGLNQALLDDTDPTPTTSDLIKGWYGGAALPNAFGGTYVPADWVDPANAKIKAAYSGAFAISCRSCHASRVAASLAFPAFTDLNKKKDKVTDLVYTFAKNAQPMPNALRTFTIFWGSKGANVIKPPAAAPPLPPPDQTVLLQQALGLPSSDPIIP